MLGKKISLRLKIKHIALMLVIATVLSGFIYVIASQDIKKAKIDVKNAQGNNPFSNERERE